MNAMEKRKSYSLALEFVRISEISPGEGVGNKLAFRSVLSDRKHPSV